MNTTVTGGRRIVPDSDAKTSGGARVRILAALRELTLASGIEAVSVSDVVARAGVARSTYYENFENKDDGFQAMLEPMLDTLAEACDARGDGRRLAALLEHVRATPATRNAVAGKGRALCIAALTRLIAMRLEVAGLGTYHARAFPLPLVAAWIAEAQVGVIAAWLAGNDATPVDSVAALIGTAARNCAEALRAASAVPFSQAARGNVTRY